MTDKKGVSVILCCYNSELRLPTTIKYLAEQQVPKDIDWEVIVVNNASSDSTVKVAELEWKKYQLPIPFYIITENTPGLTNARAAGIKKANYDTMLFCDDDNWLFANYLELSYLYGEQNRELGIWGAGESIAVYETPAPDWLIPYVGMLAVFKKEQNQIGTNLNDNVSVSGAGMCITRLYANKYLEFLEREPIRKSLDRIGNIPMAGGDSDMQYIAYQCGFKIAWFTDLKFYHFMPSGRLSKKYILNLKKYMSFSLIVLNFINKQKQTNWRLSGLIYYLFKTFFSNQMEFRMTIAGLIGHYKGMNYVKKIKV